MKMVATAVAPLVVLYSPPARAIDERSLAFPLHFRAFVHAFVLWTDPSWTRWVLACANQYCWFTLQSRYYTLCAILIYELLTYYNREELTTTML